MSFVEEPTKKRPGDIIMTSQGYVRRTRTGFVPWSPSEARKKGKRK